MLDALSTFGASITRRIVDAMTASPQATFDSRTFNRAARAIMWAVALRAVLAGHLRIITRPSKPKPAGLVTPAVTPLGTLPAARRTRPPRQPAGLTRAMRTAFAKQPIGAIAARICQDLGVTNASDLWPQDLLAAAETPAEWSATHYPRRQPTPRPRRHPLPPAARAAAPEPSPRPLPTAPPLPTPSLLPTPPETPCALHWRPPPRAPSLRQRLLRDTFSLP